MTLSSMTFIEQFKSENLTCLQIDHFKGGSSLIETISLENVTGFEMYF